MATKRVIVQTKNLAIRGHKHDWCLLLRLQNSQFFCANLFLMHQTFLLKIIPNLGREKIRARFLFLFFFFYRSPGSHPGNFGSGHPTTTPLPWVSVFLTHPDPKFYPPQTKRVNIFRGHAAPGPHPREVGPGQLDQYRPGGTVEGGGAT